MIGIGLRALSLEEKVGSCSNSEHANAKTDIATDSIAARVTTIFGIHVSL
jgi:hypothetical protein